MIHTEMFLKHSQALHEIHHSDLTTEPHCKMLPLSVSWDQLEARLPAQPSPGSKGSVQAPQAVFVATALEAQRPSLKVVLVTH